MALALEMTAPAGNSAPRRSDAIGGVIARQDLVDPGVQLDLAPFFLIRATKASLIFCEVPTG